MGERAKGRENGLGTGQRIAIAAGTGAAVLGGLVVGAKRGLDYATGSSSENFAAVSWRPIQQKAEDIEGWVRFTGDPESGRLPRNYRSVGLLAVGDVELGELSDHYYDVTPAVAFEFHDRVIMGQMRNNQTFGRSLDDPGLSVVGARIGRGDLQVAAGLWVPEEGKFVVPASLDAYGEPVPIDRITEQYPLVPFV